MPAHAALKGWVRTDNGGLPQDVEKAVEQRWSGDTSARPLLHQLGSSSKGARIPAREGVMRSVVRGRKRVLLTGLSTKRLEGKERDEG